MPELIEIEYYRQLAERCGGRAITEVLAPDDWYLKGGTTVEALEFALGHAVVTGTRRIGKLLLLDTSGGHMLGLRFGMTGRLIVDGHSAIERLEYGSNRDKPEWDRFGLVFADGGNLRIQDPRRLGGVELDPDESRLGIDAASISPALLRRALHGSTTSLKARLLDQSRIAGIGNLLVDETLWRAGLDPARPAGSLTGSEVRRLAKHTTATISQLTRRGGSHTGDLHIARQRGSRCPRDGAPLDRRTIGGRTTYSCPVHQK